MWDDADRHSRCKHLRIWSEAEHIRRSQFHAVSEQLQIILCVLLAENRQRGSLQISGNSIHSGIMFRVREVLEPTPGVRIDLEEPARALRSMI